MNLVCKPKMKWLESWHYGSNQGPGGLVMVRTCLHTGGSSWSAGCGRDWTRWCAYGSCMAHMCGNVLEQVLGGLEPGLRRKLLDEMLSAGLEQGARDGYQQGAHGAGCRQSEAHRQVHGLQAKGHKRGIFGCGQVAQTACELGRSAWHG